MDSTTTHTSTCLEFVTTSVYFNLIGSMKVSAKPITSSAHREESLGRAHQCHSLYICPLSRPIACCVHKPYMVHDLSFVSPLDTFHSERNRPCSGAGVSIIPCPRLPTLKGRVFLESDGRSVSQEFTDIIELYYHFVKALTDTLKFVTVVNSLHKSCVGHRLRSRAGLYLGKVFREVYLLSASGDWSPLY